MLTAARRMNRARAVLPRRRRARRAAARRAARVIRRAPLPPGHPAAGLLEDDCAALLPLPTGTTPGPRSPAARSPWDWVPSASRRSTPRPTRSWRPAPRERGDAPMDSADPTLQLRLLCMRPGGRGCSGRQGSPCASRPRGSTGRTCGSPRAGAATTCTFLSDIAMNIASMDY